MEQALLDVQAFVSFFQNSYMPQGTKWILAGEADSASLAAWYTQEFLGTNAEGINKQFIASIASSAALEAKADFSDFFMQFGAASQNLTGTNMCNVLIRAGSHTVSNLLSQGADDGRQRVAKLFNACEAEISEKNEFYFKWAVSEVIASSLVLNTPPEWSLNGTCAAALTSHGDTTCSTQKKEK